MLATDRMAVANSNPHSSTEPLVWKQIIAPAQPFLEQVARCLSEQVSEFERDIAIYAEYALSNQGKQIRPALVALSGAAAGKLNDSHVMAAVIIEMVHLATLVHDDVMDEARIRRGRPTLAANWGSEISVLLGDCLFAHALKLAAGFPTTEICRAVSSATKAVCSGEILQTQRRKNFELSRSEYFRFIQMKTGELFALSCDLGAYLSGASTWQRAALRQYGMALGTAYQVYDDCLDLFGSEVAVGKSLGTDLAKGKLTLPIILAMERSSVEERESIETLVRTWMPDHWPALMDILRRQDALNGSRAAVVEQLEIARDRLSAVPENESRLALFAIADYLTVQTETIGGEV